MPDFIPRGDDEFDTFFTDQFVPYVEANWLALGLTEAEKDAVVAQGVSWSAAWTGYTVASAAKLAARDTKDGARGISLEMIRPLIARMQLNPAITAAQREAMGIPVRKKTKSPAPEPSTPPAIRRIDSATRAVLRLFIADPTAPTSTAKPPGVHACEIRARVGGQMPTNPAHMPLLAVETRMPYRAEFDAEEIGAPVYFAFRWLNTRGRPGPWSQVYQSMVPG